MSTTEMYRQLLTNAVSGSALMGGCCGSALIGGATGSALIGGEIKPRKQYLADMTDIIADEEKYGPRPPRVRSTMVKIHNPDYIKKGFKGHDDPNNEPFKEVSRDNPQYMETVAYNKSMRQLTSKQTRLANAYAMDNKLIEINQERKAEKKRPLTRLSKVDQCIVKCEQKQITDKLKSRVTREDWFNPYVREEMAELIKNPEKREVSAETKAKAKATREAKKALKKIEDQP